MSEDIVLKAEARERVGKGASRELRRNGMVPAVIYGDKKDPLAIALPRKELTIRLQSGGFMTTVLHIEVNGEQHRVLPKDYQLEPVRDFLQHIDFYRLTKGATLMVEIPVQYINEDQCKGMSRGGVLNVVRHTVEVECRASMIPEALIADLAGLDLGDSLHISDVEMPEGVELTITDRDFTLATVAAPAGIKEDLKSEGSESDAASAEAGDSEEGADS